jgi:hypothetical protein
MCIEPPLPGIAAAAPGQLGHHAVRVHAAGQHVAVVAIAVMTWSPSQRGLHADHDRFLADIEVAEAADQPHAVELARLLLEAADQQHVAVGFFISSADGSGFVFDILLSLGFFFVLLLVTSNDSLS